MASRRMFSLSVVDSDAFLDMPSSTQNLYFHLNMRADDDGFVNSYKKIIKIIGASEDDLKLLIMKKFILPFDSGVVVIKHWRINNLLRKDRYRETNYLEEKKQIAVEENGSYTYASAIELDNVNQMSTNGIPLVDVGKDRLGKDSIGNNIYSENQQELFNKFWDTYPRKVNKTKAKTSFMRVCRNGEVFNSIMAALVLQKETEQWQNEKYIPHPTTWLNGERWNDEIECGGTGNARDKEIDSIIANSGIIQL